MTVNKEFSITFWIRVSHNPRWKEDNSEINFPPITANNGAMVFFSKDGKKLKVYILHPELGYKKLDANIEQFIKKDAFIALTNSQEVTKLYVNGELIKSLESAAKYKIESGDYVMVQVEPGDSKSINIGENIQVILPAKIVDIKEGGKTIKLQTFNPLEILELPKERLVM